MIRRGGGVVAVLALAVLVNGCDDRRLAPAAEPSSGRVLVLGFDGLDPDTVDTLVAEGRLPSFARLAAEGATGRLESMRPLLSPIVWTTIATGREPSEHGIVNFVTRSPETGEELPITSRQRRVRALWNIASERDLEVSVVGWWATWPAERVSGQIVSDRTNDHFLLGSGRTAERPVGTTFPEALLEEIEPMLRSSDSLTETDLSPFVNALAAEAELDEAHLRWAVAATMSNAAVGLHLWESRRPDLAMVYFEGTDTLAHLFGHLFRQDDLAGDLAAQSARYGGAVEAMYELADQLLGSFMERLDNTTTLVVVSDHGFELGALHSDPSKALDLRRVSHRFHRLHGYLGLLGPRVAAGERLERAHVLDITPTVLAGLGLPPSSEMPGRVLVPALGLGLGPPLPSYESRPRPRVPTAERNEIVDAAAMDRLAALGYVGSTVHDTAAQDRNMAGILLQEGRFVEAEELYRTLLATSPGDSVLLTFYGAALLGLDRPSTALEAIDRAVQIAPDFAPAHHQRGLALARLGDEEGAIEAWKSAARLDTKLRGPREQLARRGVPVTEQADSAAEATVSRLLGTARSQAQAGRFESALITLDECLSILPDAAVVHQYRGNVLFLMDRHEEAIAALERAVQLDPNDLRSRENLRRLRARSAGAGG